jgi:hypothetical protein
MKLKLFYAISRLSVLFCLAVLCGCAGRAQSNLSYIPPESKAEIQQKALLPCNIKQAQLAVTRYFNTAFSVQPESGATPSKLVFKLAVPEEELQNVLDCGILSVLTPFVEDSSKWSFYEKRITPSASDKPNIFAAATPETDFLLADGTSTPKPAQVKAKANVTITISLTSPEKGKTLLDISAAYVMDISLRRWVMVSGFSPMMPERVSKRFLDEAQIAFYSGEIGVPSKQLPEQRPCAGCISGDWPIQCVSTGAFEKKIINGVTASIAQ